MSKISFYEQVGIIIPGAVLLFGLLLYFPSLRTVIAPDGINLGGFGLFVLISYASGHLVAALGNLLESVFWSTQGGMPSEWLLKSDQSLLSSHQLSVLKQKLSDRLSLRFSTDRREWRPMSRQLYADVMKNGNVSRVEVFNGNYGLNRGLCGAMLCLAVISIVSPTDWRTTAALVALAIVFGFRARRFAIHYARELFTQFLLLPNLSENVKSNSER